MPDRTIYSISSKGKTELLETLEHSILNFDYDVNIFSIAVFFIGVYSCSEQENLLAKRLSILQKYLDGIDKQIANLSNLGVPSISIANVQRIHDIVAAEISGTTKLIEVVRQS